MRKPHAKDATPGHCQAEILKLLGDYTTLRIIDFLRSGELRFTELQRALSDTNSVTLTKRLKALKAAGMVDRREATFDMQSVAYQLSDLGRGLLPVLREIQRFTQRTMGHAPADDPKTRKSPTWGPLRDEHT
jgi:DNA-binding HxlR family transcriptional regulator